MTTKRDPAAIRATFTSWDYYLTSISNSDGLDAAEKLTVSQEFLLIKEVLGEDWLSRAFDNQCQVIQTLLNSAPWVMRKFARFGRQLRMVRHLPGFALVAPVLCVRDQYSRAMDQVELGASYTSCGFKIAFEPKTDGNAKADLMVDVTPPHFIELKEQDDGIDTKQATDTFMKLSLFMIGETKGLGHGGRVFRTLSSPHLSELMKRVSAAIAEVRAGKPVALVEEPDTFELYFYQTQHEDRVPSEYRKQVLGPASGGDEIRRIIRTIETAARRQLPKGRPSILVIRDPSLGIYQLLHKDPAFLASQLEESVYAHSHLVAVVVKTRIGGSSTPFQSPIGKHIHFHRTQSTFESDTGIVLTNRFGVFPLDHKVLDPIVTAVAL